MSNTGTTYTAITTVTSTTTEGAVTYDIGTLIDTASNSYDPAVMSHTIIVDRTAPVITLTGSASVTLDAGDTYTEEGATADTGETVTVTGTVDTDTPGDYTITYTATDAAGNTGTASRTVIVAGLTGSFAGRPGEKHPGPPPLAPVMKISEAEVFEFESRPEDSFSHLSLGSAGEDVRQLQIFLNQNGYLVSETGYGSPGNETDYFGEKTLRAYTAYQKSLDSSPSTNYFESAIKGTTKDEVIDSHDGEMYYSIGDSHETIREVQRLLNGTVCLVAAGGPGSPGKETSYFGRLTERAINCFRESVGKVQNGVLTEEIYHALVAAEKHVTYTDTTTGFDTGDVPVDIPVSDNVREYEPAPFLYPLYPSYLIPPRLLGFFPWF